ncbi:ubiquinol-cytochrome c reductase iron-sulfur subunit [Paremcibacter congregatus]|uniref:Ubiquinol-cytochrome c reductase iron-sulfur subunit n=1 Tax=Paremcibacter congregatus TaxID=2043170 RepID=A0A2G4YN02_9PROT|nr:ubiquinol-cytochrome c reductase iron-sulfur subunit [Paremcibacter congregatus]PHZ83673.1 ubiquinol-cytochrome c reductase iron-sulfur subunit [Paremcibacter congregatus]QDE27376.1 ubiquinol-cytochrome c reductase iron-sulfur subunit [Paremcibacter congregatus]|tara:strand:+ start:3657 stop:4187 length:531 start_codon:yes stop_codon:yes gene_type:complete
MTTTDHSEHDEDVTRRNFLYVAAGAVGTVGVASAAWPLVDQMNPSADVLALASVEVDLSSIPRGQTVKILWRGKPVFIRHRTDAEIAKAVADDTADLRDPQTDEQRTEKPEWLIMVGVCTHLGCVPLDQRGEFGGWFCPCHGSHYDISGRIRKGPAPRNMEVPTYAFLNDTTVKIG